MPDKKALFVGCSFTADSGFKQENRPKYHWPYLFCQQTDHQLVNRAIGGMSNDEIFYRANEEIELGSYDLVVIMWSRIGRHWVYHSEKNIDDFTIINGGDIKGFQSNTEHTKMYAKLHYLYFNNNYINIKRWLLQCLALEKMLKFNNIPFIFIKGFENNITEINNALFDNGFTNIDQLKSMLDFDNRPDDYILSKLTTLKRLLAAQDQTHWMNLNSKSFNDSQTDRSDDFMHPGPVTNKKLLDNLITFYKGLYEQPV